MKIQRTPSTRQCRSSATSDVYNKPLITFSWSGLMPQDLFQKIVADAALDAQRDVFFVQRLAQSEDHPVSGNFPEGYYLKGLVCKV